VPTRPRLSCSRRRHCWNWASSCVWALLSPHPTLRASSFPHQALRIACRVSPHIAHGNPRPLQETAGECVVVASCTTCVICRDVLGARCMSKGQLVIVGADVGVPVVYHHYALHWPHTHNSMCEFAREPTQTSRLTNGRSKARDSMIDSMTPGVLKPKPSAKSFGCCALTTRTQYRIEDNTPPLAVPSAEVSPKRCTSVPAGTRSGVRK
jgi:hypothetical protein